MIAFDLDGTLSESKQQLGISMANGLKRLSEDYYIAIVSGASLKQFELQVIPTLEIVEFPLDRLFLVTTNGGTVYHHLEDSWVDITPWFRLDEYDVLAIGNALWDALISMEWYGIDVPVLMEDQVENRGSQVTFSACGQNAPLDVKMVFDPDQKKRRELVDALRPILPEKYDISIGGLTSIDITLKGVSKAAGLKRLMNFLYIDIEDVLYIGDALFEGGNDYCVKEAGFTTMQITGPRQTLQLIDDL